MVSFNILFISILIVLDKPYNSLKTLLISILKVQTEKNTQLVDIHNNNFKATLDIVIMHPESFEYGFDSLSNFMSTVKSPDEHFAYSTGIFNKKSNPVL